MSTKTPQRWSVDLGDRDRCAVMVLGMKANGLRGVPDFVRVGWWMGQWIRRVQPKLAEGSQDGLLGMHTNIHSPLHISVTMYWESTEAVQSWAYERLAPHLSWMRGYNREMKSGGALGIYHELYELTPGSFEAIYMNTPRWGMGTWADVIDLTHSRDRSVHRMRRGARPTPGGEPVPAAQTLNSVENADRV